MCTSMMIDLFAVEQNGFWILYLPMTLYTYFCLYFTAKNGRLVKNISKALNGKFLKVQNSSWTGIKEN